MSNAPDGFDAIGVVVDWIDACKQRRLDDLLDLLPSRTDVASRTCQARKVPTRDIALQ